MTAKQVRISLAVWLCAAVAAAQVPGMPPGANPMGAGVQIPQVELSDQSARKAIDALLAMRDKYGDKAPGVKARGSSAAAFSALEGVTSIIRQHGFSSTEEWHKAVVSVAMAYGFAREKTDVDESIAKIQNNPQIPAALKQQMLAMMKGVQPSDNNLEIVRGLMSDATYAEKLKRFSQ